MKQLIIDYGIIYNRLAILEEKKLVELIVENKYDKSLVGNIYLGRVCNVLNSMAASFVDIGMSKNGYLQMKKNVVKNGSEILVQVKKDAVGDKGVTLTTELSLSGQYVVLLPENKQRLVSKKVKKQDDIDRLRTAALKNLKEEHGFIIRTDAVEVDLSVIEEEILLLQDKWDVVKLNRNRILKNKLVYEDFSFDDMILKEYVNSVDEIVLNKTVIPILFDKLKSKVKLSKGEYPIFELYKVEEQITEGLSREVRLHQGSFITIDETEAMTVIDVNSGKYIGSHNKEETFLQVNLASAKEIARQIKLRNVSGIIIIDFINMKEKSNYDFLISALRKYFAQDKCQPKVHGLSTLGLVEVTRRKNRKSLNTIILKECDLCCGSGYHYSDDIVCMKFIQKLERLIHHTDKNSFNVKVSILMNDLLNSNFKDNKTYLKLIEEEYNITVNVEINSTFEGFKYETCGK